jgi:hypothetical protein
MSGPLVPHGAISGRLCEFYADLEAVPDSTWRVPNLGVASSSAAEFLHRFSPGKWPSYHAGHRGLPSKNGAAESVWAGDAAGEE